MALSYELVKNMLLCSGFKVTTEALCTSGCELVMFGKENTDIECYKGGQLEQEILLACSIWDKKSLRKTGVAATFTSGSFRFVRVRKETFMDIVCRHPETEWMTLFNEYDVKKTLEVLDGT